MKPDTFRIFIHTNRNGVKYTTTFFLTDDGVEMESHGGHHSCEEFRIWRSTVVYPELCAVFAELGLPKPHQDIVKLDQI